MGTGEDLTPVEKAEYNRLCRKIWAASELHWIPKECMEAFHHLTETPFAEMVFTRRLFTEGEEPELLLKHRDDEHWRDMYHFPGTKHRVSQEFGNPLQVAQALAELEFKGIRIARAILVGHNQWKLQSEGGDHPWCNALSLVTLCEVEEGTLELTGKQRFFTFEEAKQLRMPTHHLDFFEWCRGVSMTGRPHIFTR